tara:strand:- start:145 stop:624 length:480 start_codon:yes stop_codon:yes gene_type:complete
MNIIHKNIIINDISKEKIEQYIYNFSIHPNYKLFNSDIFNTDVSAGIKYNISNNSFSAKGSSLDLYIMFKDKKFLPYLNFLIEYAKKHNKLPEKSFNDNLTHSVVQHTDEEQICAITREILKVGDNITTTECNHVFLSAPLKKYLTQYKNQCPQCRKVL